MLKKKNIGENNYGIRFLLMVWQFATHAPSSYEYVPRPLVMEDILGSLSLKMYSIYRKENMYESSFYIGQEAARGY